MAFHKKSWKKLNAFPSIPMLLPAGLAFSRQPLRYQHKMLYGEILLGESIKVVVTVFGIDLIIQETFNGIRWPSFGHCAWTIPVYCCIYQDNSFERSSLNLKSSFTISARHLSRLISAKGFSDKAVFNSLDFRQFMRADFDHLQ